MLKDKTFSKRTRTRISKTMARPTITYGMETIILIKNEEDKFQILERKIIRTIMGPQKMSESKSRQTVNFEIELILRSKTL